MNKFQIAWLSIGLAFLLILVARNLPNENPFSIVQFPGWTLAFGMFFTAEDNITTAILFQSIYWIVNVCLWFFFFFALMSTVYWLKRHASNRSKKAAG